MKTKLQLEIRAQPDDTTCGPTCLHAVYHYFNDPLPLSQVIDEVPSLPGGGTIAGTLGCHALRRGYRATIFTYNVNVFDPTWFTTPGIDLKERLLRQAEAKSNPRLARDTQTYVDYLDLGGIFRFRDLTPSLLRRYLNRGIPILTGLSSTFLYQAMREYGSDMADDDLRGHPAGHFVVLCGYDKEKRLIDIADPLESNPYSADRHYALGIERVIGAILLGIVTHDANLLILEPRP
ncbi:MAG TPA: hypothetical protein PKE55_13060 [Kiritimatiellia bacterium]|nr:hypothetical protein [Kiritimatiellia bacterium]